MLREARIISCMWGRDIARKRDAHDDGATMTSDGVRIRKIVEAKPARVRSGEVLGGVQVSV